MVRTEEQRACNREYKRRQRERDRTGVPFVPKGSSRRVLPRKLGGQNLGLFEVLPLSWHLLLAVKSVRELLATESLGVYSYKSKVEQEVWTNRSGYTFRRCCGELLTVGNCRPCRAARRKRERHQNPELRKSESLQKRIKKHGGELQVILYDMLIEIRGELRIDRERLKEIDREFKRALTKARKKEKALPWTTTSQVCIDCGKSYEVFFWTFSDRCRECSKRFRLANHGGGPRRRCKHFDIPYESFNPLIVYEDCGWVCHLCHKPVDRALLGDYQNGMSPTMDHLWPLSVKIGGFKSPGHVRANVRLAHKSCNTKKGDRISLEEAETLLWLFCPTGFEKFNGDVSSQYDAEFEHTCQHCQKRFVSHSPHSLYCGRKCLDGHRRPVKVKPVFEPRICLYCQESYTPVHIEQKFCRKGHRDSFRENGKRPRGTASVAQTLICLYCQKSFISVNKRKFCIASHGNSFRNNGNRPRGSVKRPRGSGRRFTLRPAMRQ